MSDPQTKGWIARERARYLSESYAADVGLGVMAGTKVATAVGWRAVEALKVGDKVLTFDNKMQPLTWVERRMIFCGRSSDPATWPLQVPAGALGNAEAMFLMPSQPIVIDTDLAEMVFGLPYVLIPAVALIGRFGIERARPEAPIEAVRFGFETPEVVFANTGAMFHCHDHTDYSGDLPEGRGLYTVLEEDAAAHFLSCIEDGNYPVRARN